MSDLVRYITICGNVIINCVLMSLEISCEFTCANFVKTLNDRL